MPKKKYHGTKIHHFPLFAILVGVLGIFAVGFFMGKSSLPNAEAHITEDITSLYITLITPTNGQVVGMGSTVTITPQVAVNGVNQFAYPVEYYVNNVKVCTDLNNGARKVNAQCNWKVPRTKTMMNYSILVKAYATGSAGDLVATATANVTAK